MKPFFSWLLILIMSFHWIIGYLCFQIDYSVEIERVMNEMEKKIAEAVKEEMGMDIHVEIFQKDLSDVENFGYSGRFIFSKEIEGKTYYYKINPNPIEIVNQEYIFYQYPDAEGDKMILFQRLFSKFTVQDFSLPAPVKDRELPERNFIYAGFQDIFPPAIPSPPPEWV